MELLRSVLAVAEDHGATPAQVALAWLAAQGEDVVPIPGTKRRRFLEQNAGALGVRLSREEVERLGRLAPVGARYPDMAWVAGDTPPA